MSPSPDRYPVAVLAAIVFFSWVAPAAGGQPRPVGGEGLPLRTEPLDLVLGVEALDGSVVDLESATRSETILATDVLFEFDRADLGRAADTTLSQVADNIKANAKGPVQVHGYTDSEGEDAYNQDLSHRRAAAVAAALKSRLGGRSTDLRPTGHGENDPVAPNANPDGSDNPAGRAKNRRVTITFPK
jgi:OmpA-OmpF porin, OOP family